MGMVHKRTFGSKLLATGKLKLREIGPYNHNYLTVLNVYKVAENREKGSPKKT